jgi:hypothetical protein
MMSPHPNRWLVRLAPLEVTQRKLRQSGTAQLKLLDVLRSMDVEAGEEITARELYRHVGLRTGTRKQSAVKEAVRRMLRNETKRPPELARVRRGVFRRL